MLGGSGGGGGSSTGNARVLGMYFFHPDHLGSITMISDGNGNVLAGGERGGKSHITYKPYGEIFRTDSYGPDITKFKYTGQEEDQESGLYYYKARYYDAGLARFVSNDGMVFPDKEQWMNRMMYVEGNPVAFVDPGGNKLGKSFLYAIGMYAFIKDNNTLNDQQKLLWIYQAFLKGKSLDRKSLQNHQRWDISKGLDNIKKINFENFALLSVAMVPGGGFLSAFFKKTRDGQRKAKKQARKDYYYDTINTINCGPGGRLEGNTACVAIMNNYYERYKYAFTLESYMYHLALTSSAVPCGLGGSVGVNSGYRYGAWAGFVNTVIDIIRGFKVKSDDDSNGCISNI